MSESAAHMSILREENIALRCILGYDLASLSSSPYTVPYLGDCLPDSQIKDVLLIGLDVGCPRIFLGPEEQSHQIGVSVFDTRCLVQPRSNEEVIASYQFITTAFRVCVLAAKRFLLGSTELMSLSALGDRIKKLTRGRHYILAGHELREDIRLLRHIDTEIVDKALYVINTVKLAQFPLQLHYRYQLQELLDACSIESSNLHCAGNKAHFVLKALLMLAVWDARQTDLPRSSDEKVLLRRLRDIARAPLPSLVRATSPATKGGACEAKDAGRESKMKIEESQEATKKAL